MMYCGEEVLLEFLPEGHHLIFPLVCKRWHNALKKAGRKSITYYSVACQSIEMLEHMQVSRSDDRFFHRIVKDGNHEIVQYAIDRDFMKSVFTRSQIPLLGSLSLNLQSIKFDKVFRTTQFENAIRAGDRESVLWMITECENGMNLRSDAVEFFAKNSMFDEMKKLNIAPSSDLYNALIDNNDIRINQLIHDHDLKPSKHNLARAAGASDFQLMKRIISEMPNENDLVYVMEYAVQFGKLESIQFLHGHGARLTPHEIEDSCRFGHLDIVEWAASNGYALEPEYVILAIESGHLKMVMFLIEHGVLEAGAPISYLYGTVEIFDYLCKQGHRWMSDNLPAAICLNRLELIDWMISKKVALTPVMASQAALVGNRKFLEYYWEEMKEFPQDILKQAFQNDDASLTAWIVGLGYEISTYYIKGAVEHDSLSVLQWLHENNLIKNVKKESKRYLPEASLRIYRWVLDDNLTLVDLNNAIKHSSYEIIEWMYLKNRDSWVLDKLIDICNNPELDGREPNYGRFNEEYENPLYVLIDRKMLKLRDLLKKK